MNNEVEKLHQKVLKRGSEDHQKLPKNQALKGSQKQLSPNSERDIRS
jgi:hypothetical protein